MTNEKDGQEIEQKKTAVEPLGDELPPQEEKPKGWRRQRFLEAQGKQVSLDYFLYSCVEQERILKATFKDAVVPVRWPLLPPQVGATPEGGLTGELTELPLSGLVQKLSAWYRDEHPAIASPRVLDHEQMVQVAPIVVAFNMDVTDLYRLKTGEQLPDYERSVGNNKFWDDLEKVVTDNFATYAPLIMRYVKWSHADEPVEEFAPGSRPPIGKYAPPMLPRSKGGRDGRSAGRGERGDRGGRGGDRPPRGERPERGARAGGGERGDRPPRPERPERGERPEKEARGERPERPERGERPEREARGERPERGERGPRAGRSGGERGERGPRRSGEESQRLEAAAMAEVDAAIATLRGNPALDEVTLKPANSFYRRLQHQKVIDAGYHSFSVGEGNDRAVKVSRKDA